MSVAISQARMWVQSIELDELGNTVRIGKYTPNAPLKGGKLALGHAIVSGTGATALSGGFIYVCAGSGGSGAPPISYDDDRLGGTLASHASAHEYIGNANRKVLLATNTGSAVTTNDWEEDEVTIDGKTYHYLLSGYVLYEPGDGNSVASPGVPFNRYGLANAIATPATVTGVSGVLLNEVIDTQTLMKTDANTLRINVELRI